MKTIAVLGASRGVGLACVKTGLEQGFDVHALARNTSPLSKNQNLKVFAGSATDSSIVSETVRGAGAVILTIGAAITSRPVSVFSESAQTLVEALKKTNPGAYLVLVTGIGAGDSKGKGGFLYDKIILPLLLKTIYADKDRQEELVRKSGLQWTIVRPGFLTNARASGKFRVLTQMENARARSISREDCAQFLVTECASRKYAGQTVYLG